MKKLNLIKSNPNPDIEACELVSDVLNERKSLIKSSKEPFPVIDVLKNPDLYDLSSISDEQFEALYNQALNNDYSILDSTINQARNIKSPIIKKLLISIITNNEPIEPSNPITPDDFQKITDSLHDTYIKKNSDYGSSFDKGFQKFGWVSILTRLYDKFNRLESLTINNNDPQVKSESIEDTLLDLANYAILSILALKNQNP